MAFLIHLRDVEDLAHVLPFLPKFLFNKILRRPLLSLFWKLNGRQGFSVVSKFHINQEVDGCIILIWLTGAQVMDPSKNKMVKKRILDAALYAQNCLGCSVIGLGALTASVTKSGEWLAQRPEIKIAITHGDSYAAALAIQGVNKIVQKINLPKRDSTLAVVGATGIIGEAVSLALAQKFDKLILIGRDTFRLKTLQEEAQKRGCQAIIDSDLIQVKNADIVITATSAPKAIIKAEHLKQNAIIFEVSQPRNVSPALTKQRPDILLIDGSIAMVPQGIKFWWMSLPPQHTFGCMAETILQTIANDNNHHVGKVDPLFMNIVVKRGSMWGFPMAPFTSFGKLILPEKFIETSQK
jgi:predicted amino acid dehydrogenase